LRLSWHAIDAITRHAVADYPSECCGVVTGNHAFQRVHPLVNIQDRLHAEDPDTHPRDSRTAYAVDRTEIDRITRKFSQNGDTIIAFYHSHIDCDAYFSQMDKEVQTVFGEPEYPDALHLVVSVMKGNLYCMKCYLWDIPKQDFVNVEMG